MLHDAYISLFIDEDTEALSIAGWEVVRTGSISSDDITLSL